ncbi:hypothetical protein HPB51_019948 [Rhipicephalus microplus]|uniref:Uncharacterized protein n=1 Tax=Rhipicephalus microplus TaxID=6941 RepID=A0A9J6E2T7_RHIMP|nr:hypothetical protein HPB51_019948 [Rhipicephalus microplus]
MHPTEDDTSSTALEPPVPTTQESLAQAQGAPASSHIPAPAPHQPLLSEFDIQDTPNNPQRSSAGGSLPISDCLQAFVSQGDLAARLSVIEEQSSLQQRVSTTVERIVPLSVQPRFFGAQLSLPNFDDTTSWVAFLVQFESVAALNGWTVQNKAQALAVQLRGAGVEYLEYIPQVIRSNYEALVLAMETRFGDSHLLHLCLTQLKHVRQGNRDLQSSLLTSTAGPGRPCWIFLP